MDDNSLILPCEAGKSRKRPVRKENWKTSKLKAQRRRPKGLPEYPTCRHDKKSSFSYMRPKKMKIENSLKGDKSSIDILLYRPRRGIRE
ncbi:unnamed protein product [Acanthoscelides obtectus]|uniref:Uncharacterized protein n=1 Tax=Acanthoscelides obtectus TaxID=200917 RepID=A0A9P0LB57_ACAOB|nr:unnamed protein product [Acanthoscelides obtectus]CAK1640447.1 hypothetical protein AOBTE_LOCUS11727 [Acanthoscelides obtectus]